jgi:hypothetical protein
MIRVTSGERKPEPGTGRDPSQVRVAGREDADGF